MQNILLTVKDLKTYFKLREGTLKAVDGVSFTMNRGEVLGIIGESGCGKSVTGRSLMRIVPKPGYIAGGQMLLYDKDGSFIDLAALHPNDKELFKIRGGRISMVFQEPMTSLSPVHTVGDQVTEATLLHVTKDKKEAWSIAVNSLHKVGIGNAEQRMNEYPGQLSGGLRQRVMIAMALCSNPDMLIADEPTTALDVTVQAQILLLLRQLQEDIGLSILYITHDLGVISEICHRVAVMYLGKVVEVLPVGELFRCPLHPYLVDLLRSIPNANKRVDRLETIHGSVPTPIDLPRQCGYVTRCTKAIQGVCDLKIPALVAQENGHSVRCFLYSKEEESE